MCKRCKVQDSGQIYPPNPPTELIHPCWSPCFHVCVGCSPKKDIHTKARQQQLLSIEVQAPGSRKKQEVKAAHETYFEGQWDRQRLQCTVCVSLFCSTMHVLPSECSPHYPPWGCTDQFHSNPVTKHRSRGGGGLQMALPPTNTDAFGAVLLQTFLVATGQVTLEKDEGGE